MEAWRVMPIPQGDRNAILTLKPGASEEETAKVAENIGGVTIFIGQNSYNKQEFCRVGYIRRATKNPDTPFEQEFQKQLAAADALVKEINTRLEQDFPEIQSQLQEVTTKLQAQAQQLTDAATKIENEVREQVGALGERIDALANEMVEKVVPETNGLV